MRRCSVLLDAGAQCGPIHVRISVHSPYTFQEDGTDETRDKGSSIEEEAEGRADYNDDSAEVCKGGCRHPVDGLTVE